MKKHLKFFQFEHSDGAEIIVAEYARQAIHYYIDRYMDDIQIDDIVQYGGLKIEELTGDILHKKHELYNEGENKKEWLTYLELAEDVKEIPSVIIFPHY